MTLLATTRNARWIMSSCSALFTTSPHAKTLSSAIGGTTKPNASDVTSRELLSVTLQHLDAEATWTTSHLSLWAKKLIWRGRAAFTHAADVAKHFQAHRHLPFAECNKD